jgi:uncharacterized protein YjbI with pentapeptide repeats
MLNAKMIGNRITEARRKINISQARLAERLFISSQAVGKWERGESMPDIITLNHLAEILGVDLNYFSDSPGPSADEKSPEQINRSSGLTEKLEMPADKPGEQPGWDMSRGNWLNADFSGLKNLHEKFSSSNMQGCRFAGSDLSGLLLKANNVDNCDFSDSDVSNSHIQNSNLLNNIFKHCSLKETEFSGSNLDSCDFSGAGFAGVKFLKSFVYGCNFTGVDFTDMVIRSGGFSGVQKLLDKERNTISGAIWNRTSFIDTQVADLVFTGTLDNCYFENCKFTRVIFREATLVNTFFKNNKNLKKVQFIDCKADRISCEFLKQGKADLRGITLLTPKQGGEK